MGGRANTTGGMIFFRGMRKISFRGMHSASTCRRGGAAFQAIVREVDISLKNLAGEHSLYQIKFANDAANMPAFEFEAAKITTPQDATAFINSQVGAVFSAGPDCSGDYTSDFDHGQLRRGRYSADRRRNRGSVERCRMGPGQRSQSGGTIWLADVYRATAGAGTDLLSAAI